MKNYGDITNGDYVLVDRQPFQVIDTTFIQMQQRRPTMELKIRNLRNGQVLTRTFKSQHPVDEVEIEKEAIQFLYGHRGEFWFSKPNDPKSRFSMKTELIGDNGAYLKPNMEVTAIKYNDEIINIQLPIKADYKVIEAPPGVKGDTASGGNKQVIIEGGAKVAVPLFINQGDIIRINTETGLYAERMEKGK